MPPPPPPPPLLLLLMTLAVFDSVTATVVSITRLHRGDVFDVSDAKCSMETCVGMSSGTALQVSGGGGGGSGSDGISRNAQDDPVPAGGRGRPQSSGTAMAGQSSSGSGGCRCQCVQPMPVFRDDLQICVDDLPECSLASFVSGTTVQKIPYVFLPLQGQIVYPSAEIKIPGTQSPICAISKAKYLTRGGWVNFKNHTDYEIPFQIHRENGRIMLLWLGDLQSRANIEGRLVLVEMICKETIPQDYDSNSFHQAVTPCISFRIAGTPSVKEVSFSNDVRTSSDNSGATAAGLTVGELVAVAICSVLLGLMYVASVLLYLHVRKGRAAKGRNGDPEAFKNPLMSNGGGGVIEEGVVKNNPLLLQHGYNDNEAYESDDDGGGGGRHYGAGQPRADAVAAAVAASDFAADVNHRSLTTAMMHPAAVQSSSSFHSCAGHSVSYYSDSNPIEKHPEDDISIVETLDNKEERPDNIRSIVCANPRKKLYFNPDYFEVELLMAPPPAALEFLDKIREVIREAKRKITAKKFEPDLTVIPEDADEDDETTAVACDKCKTQFKIKSANIERWLMDVPVKVDESTGDDDDENRTSGGVSIPPIAAATADDDADVDDDDDDDDDEDNGGGGGDADGGREKNANIECDSLERSMSYGRIPASGYRTPSEYGSPAEQQQQCGYSLVSEVYVNDSCFVAADTLRPDEKIRIKGPGRITIEVDDCPADDGAGADESDGFEPDTLDRHCAATGMIKPRPGRTEQRQQQQQQQLRAGSAGGFGSLLEIYEAKTAMADALLRQNRRRSADAGQTPPPPQPRPDETARYLEPDPKHCRRQRCPSPPPPPPPVTRDPPCDRPPKNGRVKSIAAAAAAAVASRSPRRDRVVRPTRHGATADHHRRTRGDTGGASFQGRPSAADHCRYEDSGYLSTESNESLGAPAVAAAAAATAAAADTDESGAESMDTDFKYFRTRTETRNYCDW